MGCFGCCGLFSMTWRCRGVVMDIFGVFWVLWHILDVLLWAFLGARLSCGVVGSSGYFRVLCSAILACSGCCGVVAHSDTLLKYLNSYINDISSVIYLFYG